MPLAELSPDGNHQGLQQKTDGLFAVLPGQVTRHHSRVVVFGVCGDEEQLHVGERRASEPAQNFQV